MRKQTYSGVSYIAGRGPAHFTPPYQTFTSAIDTGPKARAFFNKANADCLKDGRLSIVKIAWIKDDLTGRFV